MFCENCGKKINNDNIYCEYCGSKISKNNIVKSVFNKRLIISIIVIIIIIISFLYSKTDSNKIIIGDNSRTIMIYMVGSNLESDHGIASADLASINSNSIDLSKNNIILYTGGTKEWKNNISNKNNGLYILKSSGFELLESQNQLNMGSPNTLADFLNYVYKNYKTDKYDLIFWNHGGAIDGALYDDFSNDNLSMSDMNVALSKSSFNKNNKIEAVLFRTCLNATLEIANVFAPYADYLIASEEVSYGSPSTPVFNFINELDQKDKGNDFGQKFINSYKNQMNILSQTITYTYSVIDLNKVEKINKLFENFISGINLNDNFSNVSKIRANSYQYGGNQNSSFDTIDLYQLITNLKNYSSVDATELLNTINEAVLFNTTNNQSSYGISIYFPYNGTNGFKNKFLTVYKNANILKKYYEFIFNFNNMMKKPTGFSFSIKNSETYFNKNEDIISVVLSDKQIKNFGSAYFIIFEKDIDHPDYYTMILSSDNVKIEDGNILKGYYNNDIIKVYNKEDGKYYPIQQSYINGHRMTHGMIYSNNKQSDGNYVNGVYIHFNTYENGKPFIDALELRNSNDLIDGAILNIDDYNMIQFLKERSYKIVDNNGNLLEKWEQNPIIKGYQVDIADLDFIYSSLDINKEYFSLFYIKDIYGETNISNIIKLEVKNE